MTPDERHQQQEQLKAELARRLRGVCAHFPKGEFDELIDQIARVEIKYALRAQPPSEPAPPAP